VEFRGRAGQRCHHQEAHLGHEVQGVHASRLVGSAAISDQERQDGARRNSQGHCASAGLGACKKVRQNREGEEGIASDSSACILKCHRAAFLTRAYGIDPTCATKAGSQKANHSADPLWTQDWEASPSYDLIRSGWQQALHRHRKREPPVGAQRSEDAAGQAVY
jgi:hypothetical protein